MAVTPLNGHNSNNRTHWLDKALEGQSPEIKARVLELILKMGIEPEDEFFVIFVALGQLQVLLLEAPEQWGEIFSRFREQLEGWTKTLDNKLALLPERGSTGDEELKESILELTRICGGLATQLNDTTESTDDLSTRVEKLDNSLKLALEFLLKQKHQLDKLLLFTTHILCMELGLVSRKRSAGEDESIASVRPAQEGEWIGGCGDFLRRRKNVLVSHTFIFLLGFGMAALMFLPPKQLLEATAQRTQWLLEKENRRDCLQGFKPKGSPECQEVLKKVKGLGKGKSAS